MDKVILFHEYTYVAQVYDANEYYATEDGISYITSDILKAEPFATMQSLALWMQEEGVETYHIVEVEELKTRRVII